MGARGKWKISVPSTQLCCDPKTALRNKAYKIFLKAGNDLKRQLGQQKNTGFGSHTATFQSLLTLLLVVISDKKMFSIFVPVFTFVK